MSDIKKEYTIENIDFIALQEQLGGVQRQIEQKKDQILAVLYWWKSLDTIVQPMDFVDGIIESIASHSVQSRVKEIVGELVELQNYQWMLVKRVVAMVDAFVETLDVQQMPIDQLLKLGNLLDALQKGSWEAQYERVGQYDDEISTSMQIKSEIELEKLLQTPLKQLWLSTRTRNCLFAADLDTLGKIRDEYKSKWPLKFRNSMFGFWEYSLQEVEALLDEKGLLE